MSKARWMQLCPLNLKLYKPKHRGPFIFVGPWGSMPLFLFSSVTLGLHNIHIAWQTTGILSMWGILQKPHLSISFWKCLLGKNSNWTSLCRYMVRSKPSGGGAVWYMPTGLTYWMVKQYKERESPNKPKISLACWSMPLLFHSLSGLHSLCLFQGSSDLLQAQIVDFDRLTAVLLC